MPNELIAEYAILLSRGTAETLYMTGFSAFVAYCVGLPLGIVLVATDRGGIAPRPGLNKALGGIVNLGRSIPFIILLIAIIPFTRLVAGTSIGSTASVVPLAIGAIPFVARLVETSLKEVNPGVIEAAEALGATPAQIVLHVLLPESLPSLVLGATITVITLIGYSAMAGAVGGGGLGDLAIRYGYYRYQSDLMVLTIVLLVLIVQALQTLGNYLSRKIDRRK